MDSMVRAISEKEGGEVSEIEDNSNPQRSSLAERTPSSLPPAAIVHEERSALIGSMSVEEAPVSSTSASVKSNVVADEIPAEDPVDDEEDDEEDDYEYEDDDDAAFSGFLDNPVTIPANGTEEPSASKPATIEEEQEAPKKWRQPSQQAVSMSLRAEKETSGGKRRLAQDLYKIMNQDTEVAGFTIGPASEDSMDKWNIQLFQFDEDSNLAKDMKVLGLKNIELEMSFPDQYPFEPPFVRVSRPRFKRQTGFVMNGALCMELLTNDGWNPINDIESVIVSIRSLLVVGDGRLEAAFNLAEEKYQSLLEAADEGKEKAVDSKDDSQAAKRQKTEEMKASDHQRRLVRDQGGAYSVSEAQAAYSHLSDYHKKKGWDTSGWWARKG